MKKLICPKCKTPIKHIIEFMKSELSYSSDDPDGVYTAGLSLGVYGICEDCHYEWKLRNFCQMTDELKDLLKKNVAN